jgi:hypothetical protein
MAPEQFDLNMIERVDIGGVKFGKGGSVTSNRDSSLTTRRSIHSAIHEPGRRPTRTRAAKFPSKLGVMAETDIAVVGGGPAGAAAAISAARDGLRVVLLDDRPHSNERPGETLHPGAEPLFRMLGVAGAVNAAAIMRHEGHWTNRGGKLHFVKFGADETGPWLGFQIRRNDLRRILIQRADDIGVCVKQGRALRPLFRHANISGVEASAGTITCRILIDASGTSHWLAKTCGDPISLLSPPLVAWYGWATSVLADQFSAPRLTIDGAGWSWIAQVDANLCAWTSLRFRNGRSRLQKPAILDGFVDVQHERGADVTWRTVRPHAGGGFFRPGSGREFAATAPGRDQSTTSASSLLN